MKKGQKLYQVVYWNGRFRQTRKMEYRTIWKIHLKTVKLYAYDGLLKKSKIGDEWFLTKEEAIKNTLRMSEEALEYDMIYSVSGSDKKAMIKEIKSLKNWLAQIKRQKANTHEQHS